MIQEILLDLLSRDRTPFRLHHTNINVKEKTPSTGMATKNENRGFFGGKSRDQPLLVKQR